MSSVLRAPGRRRFASLLLTAVGIASIAAPAGLRAADPVDAATLTAAESAMVTALNQDRDAAGLVRVRVDPRLMAIARARSDDMVAKAYFSHTQPDGRNVFDILNGAGITWYNAGEIIAWNNYPMDSTVSAANRQWMGSPGHKAIITSADYNYVGVGLAIDPATGKKLWTAVYLKGPDRTGATTKLGGTTFYPWKTSTTRTVKVTWSGSDPRLQVLTAGLSNFAVAVRVDGGAWSTITTSTTLRYRYVTVRKGHRYEIRISAKDKRGNRGAAVIRVVDMR
ncbi:MAG TPA: CAP domain-containing protein [Candidatus Limnocylindrales bacterium]|nr:CAP domain-containing protein [Candidatus Limnocylindrales bacterium]